MSKKLTAMDFALLAPDDDLEEDSIDIDSKEYNYIKEQGIKSALLTPPLYRKEQDI